MESTYGHCRSTVYYLALALGLGTWLYLPLLDLDFGGGLRRADSRGGISFPSDPDQRGSYVSPGISGSPLYPPRNQEANLRRETMDDDIMMWHLALVALQFAIL